MSDDIGLRNGREDFVLFLTSFRTNHVTCCVSAGEGAGGGGGGGGVQSAYTTLSLYTDSDTHGAFNSARHVSQGLGNPKNKTSGN